MKSPNSIVALLTDFGADSYYVAQMKGILIGLNPGLQIFDVTHSISPQNIRQAAYVLSDCVSSFPNGFTFEIYKLVLSLTFSNLLILSADDFLLLYLLLKF